MLLHVSKVHKHQIAKFTDTVKQNTSYCSTIRSFIIEISDLFATKAYCILNEGKCRQLGGHDHFTKNSFLSVLNYTRFIHFILTVHGVYNSHKLSKLLTTKLINNSLLHFNGTSRLRQYFKGRRGSFGLLCHSF